MPHYFPGFIKKSYLQDETAYLQYGQQSEDSYFNTLSIEPPVASSYNVWPTRENLEGKYKFASLFLEMDTEQLVIERSTYAILDWLGDVGGLVDGIYILTGVLLGGLFSISARANLLSLIFKLGEEQETVRRGETATPETAVANLDESGSQKSSP